MNAKRLQNYVAESKFSLPVTAIYSVVVWLLAGLMSLDLWLQLMLYATAVLAMVQLNDQNALMRIYSRMVSCSFIVLSCMVTPMLASIPAVVTMLCMAGCYLFIFRAYQDQEAAGSVFYGFALVGLASVLWPQILYFVPLLWVLMGVRVIALSVRTWFASLLGLMMPYWFVAGYMAYTGDAAGLLTHFEQLAADDMPVGPAALTPLQWATIAFLTLAAVVGMAHFLRNAYQDKIRTRMLYDIFIYTYFFTLLFLLLQPSHYLMLVGVLVVNAAPLVAHFITFTRSRITNIFAIVLALVALTLTVFHLYNPSLSWLLS